MAWEIKREQGGQDSRFHWEVLSEEKTRVKTIMGDFAVSARVLRAKVPGGWFVRLGSGASSSVIFYPDPEHAWDGGTLP